MRRIDRMPSPDTGSTASNGSSRISSRGAEISAQASPIFLVMPAEYSTTRVLRSSVRLSASSSSSDRVAMSAGGTLRSSPT